MLAVPAVLVAACPSPGGGGNPPPEETPLPEVALTFEQATVRRSKMLVSTNGNAAQTYTNTLMNNGTPVTAGAAYSITEKPAGLTNQITVNSTTGEVTFGAAALTKVNADGPQTVTVQAAYQGKTASYTFTVTDHFSPRRDHASAVLNGDLYVIGGQHTASGRSNEVWRSADGGLTWDQAAAGTTADNTLFTGRSAHTAEVIGDSIYLLGGTTDGTDRFNDVWTSADRGVTWRQTAAATPRYPTRRVHSSAVLGTTLYVIAGSISSGVSQDIWRSTNLGSTWTRITNFANFGRIINHASVVVANRVYVIGGFQFSSISYVNSVWRSAATVGATNWIQVATGTTRFSGRGEHSAVVLDGAIYVIGGGSYEDDVWRSTDQGVTWTQVATGARFSARSEHTSTALSGALYVIGGFDGTDRLNDVWKSNDQGVTWTNVHAGP